MTVTPKKLLFAISDTGGGHRSAAMAISAAIAARAGSGIDCRTIDFLRATKLPGLSKAPEIYDYCSKEHVWLNNLLFRKTNTPSRITTLTNIVYHQSHRHIENELTIAQPDAVIAVHPLVIGLLAAARQKLQASWPIIAVVTDLITIHAAWASPGADLYLVPTPEAARLLTKYKIPPQRIFHAGFPVHPKFLQNKLSKVQARQKLGLHSDCFTIMLTGGGVGAGSMEEWVQMLQNRCAGKQLLVITGNNKKLYQTLHQRQATPLLHLYGFVQNMELMMAASDLIITKAGPGTILEGIAMSRPLIITGAIGIQETGNIDYVRRHRFGYYCPTPAQACKTINEIDAGLDLNSLNPALPNTTIVDGSAMIADIILQQVGWTYAHLLDGAS